ncbi:chemotaxis protein CheB [Larkinella rosea]|uniref:protein-glutamate methylesterase n=1 Tax=Larkinella rosea TaxID=2025312 RepID=A0A3P1BBG9_9BACT|nr:chemotaxis protein CheB [Larkinella rosea]RRA97983.1 chemotaxis protein CheB [Larkinella rosea]
MNECKAVVIGGSAGSIPIVVELLKALPEHFTYSVFIVLHRLKNVASSMDMILMNKGNGILVEEPDDKEVIQGHHIYLVPQNYHLLIEPDKTISLDYSELVHYSRPSIDVTFESVAQAYAGSAVGILLSGANKDGADGLLAIVGAGGTAIVQDPATAEYPVMPQAALDRNKRVLIMKPEQIATFLHALND